MQQGRMHCGSHQYAAMAHQWVCGGRMPPAQQLHQQQRYHWQSQGQQQEQSGSLGGSMEPTPPPRWVAVPDSMLNNLQRLGAPRLTVGSPLADEGGMEVRMHLDQVRTPRGQRQPSRKDLVSMLFRVGVQRPNSTMQWADVMQQDASMSTLRVAVQDSPAARQAAREAVAAGAVTVEGLSIPVTWARQAATPSDCTQVTLHQLPLAMVRKGVGDLLLSAAQQPGVVVAEYIGGSKTTGDAALACPFADTVVLLVQGPEDDPLLANLPASFSVLDGPDVRIEVKGRPSLAPHTWPAITAAYLQAREEGLQRARAQLQPSSGSQPQQQPQQRRRQQQQQQQPQQPQQQRAQPRPRQQQPLQEQPQQHAGAATAGAATAAQGAASAGPAATACRPRHGRRSA